MLEDHVRIGRPFDFTHAPKVAECAEALRILLAKQVPHYMTGEPERKFECPIDLNPGSEWGYGGTVDLTVPPPPDAGHFGWQGWTIVDYKSTSSIEKWAKTAAVLRTDAQPIVYGFEFYARHPEVDTVRFLWLYVERESRKTLPVQIFLTRSEVVRGAMRLRRDIDRMRGIRYGAPELGVHTEKTIAYVNSLPYNSSACGAFGGCEYVGNCRLSVREMMGGQAPIGAAELVRR